MNGLKTLLSIKVSMDVRSIEVIELLYKLKGDAYISLATLMLPVQRHYIEARIAEIDIAIEKLMHIWVPTKSDD